MKQGLLVVHYQEFCLGINKNPSIKVLELNLSKLMIDTDGEPRDSLIRYLELYDYVLVTEIKLINYLLRLGLRMVVVLPPIEEKSIYEEARTVSLEEFEKDWLVIKSIDRPLLRLRNYLKEFIYGRNLLDNLVALE